MNHITLFCLPFAGGNQYSFGAFKTHLSPHIKAVPLDYPGRGSRMREGLMNSIEAMTDDLLTNIGQSLNTPYAIFGHSMGAVIGFELAQKIQQKNLPPPLHLFVSGRGAPHIPAKREDIASLPSSEFRAKLKELGGSPDEVLNNDALMELFEPILRNDFQAHFNYSCQHTQPLNMPITVMYGLDEGLNDLEIQGWQKETLQTLSVSGYPGGHFFLFEHWKEIAANINKKLQN